MKKILNTISIFLLTIIVLNCKLQKKNDISFEQYFDENFTNYDFLIKNPMFYIPTYYFPNLSELKDRYCLRIYQVYDMDSDGTKYFSDGDTWPIDYTYFKFNKEGRIEKLFLISQNSLGVIEQLTYTTYEFKNNIYIEKTINLLNKNEDITEYKILGDKEKLIFETLNSYGQKYQTIFEKGKIRQIEQREEVYELKEEYNYYDDIMIKNYYFNNKDGIEEEHDVYTYQKGVILKVFSPSKEGQSEQDYSTNKEGIGHFTYKEIIGKSVFTFSNYLERQYNKAGFLEYEIQRPLKDGNSGVYKIKKAKLLNEPDELLIKYFGDVIEKE